MYTLIDDTSNFMKLCSFQYFSEDGRFSQKIKNKNLKKGKGGQKYNVT